MYCERCNIEFPGGLRYCKWCGGELKEKARDTSELKTCPACKAAVKSKWTFCKSCGAKLTEPAVAPAPEASEPGADDVTCSNCGERLDSNSIYCKGCGSPVRQVEPGFGASSMLCANCNGYSPIGSHACRVCGAPFAVADAQRSSRAPNTLVDGQDAVDTRLDISAPFDTGERQKAQDSTIEMTSYKGPGVPVKEDGTRIISSTESGGRIDEGAQTGPQSLDDMETITMEAATGAIDMEVETITIQPDTLVMKPDTKDIGSTDPAGIGPADSGQTSIMDMTTEARPEQSVETTLLDRGRTTGPVEGEESAEEPPDISTRPISDVRPYTDSLGRTMNQFGQPVTDFTDSLGTAKPAESNKPGTSAIASGGLPPSSPLPPGFNDAQTRAISEPGAASPDPRTAPFGLEQFQPPPQNVPVQQQPWPEQQNIPPQSIAPETRVMPPPQPVHPQMQQQPFPQPQVQQQPPRSKLPVILSAVVVVLILAAGGVAAWWFIAGGPRAEPVSQPDVAVNPPAPDPAPAPPPPEVKPPTVPDGMVLIPGGRYIIGRDDGDVLARPQRVIDVAPFYIDITEVTNAQYMLFVDAKNRQPPPGWKDGMFPQDQANFPVTGVSWQDASEYAAWAGKRLPTEIEWEAAARGPDGRVYPWGNEWRRGLANVGTSGIREVGQYRDGASPFGALDMLGNVWEWTADELALYPGSTAQLPVETKPGVSYRVIRGGAYDGVKENDASHRGFVDAGKGYPKTGFRCVKDAR